MPYIRVPQPWQLPESAVTPRSVFLNRRRFMTQLIGAGVGAATLPLLHTQASAQEDSSGSDAISDLLGTKRLMREASLNPDFSDAGRELTTEEIATTYNNFYEFGYAKDIWRKARVIPTEDWKVEVTGLVNNPKTYDVDDILKRFPIEERIYRLRCVEAWAMTIPWLGFPMRLLLEEVDPKPEAKFASFQSFYDPKLTPGPFWSPAGNLPWPYTEGLRIDEMANDLALFAVGMYDQLLPKQNGAPIRMIVPWKYGFKSGKSVVRIEFVADQPPTFWNTVAPNEYGFGANVDPSVPHPRWSQEQERLVSSGPQFTWERVPTQIYNGYGEWVADLYT